MPSLHPYNQLGQWYKGNLHCHTTESDGIRSPMEVMDWYAKHDYDFITMTDHNRLTKPEEFGQPPLLAIPGTELTCRRGDMEYHVIGIGLAEMPIDAQHDPQEAIDSINTAGGISFVAHPYWHGLQLDDLIDLRGHIGIEIYNTSCWMEIQKGHSLVHWDALTSRGQRVWGLAVDDSHWINPDFGGGWIVVKTDHFDQDGILESLKSGNFYSSSGPEIHDICVDGDELKVTCSPARSIYVFDQYHFSPLSANVWGKESLEEGCSNLFEMIQTKKPITEATFRLDPRQEVLRIEVVDFLGRSAWSNPYFKNHGGQSWE
jgi:hypothetical protein